MRYFKHKKTNQYLFIDNSSPVWFEAFLFNTTKNQIKADYEYSEKDNKKEITKKLETYIAKYEKKGFQELDISQEVVAKTEAFCEKVAFGKVYYFHLESKATVLEQKLTVLKVSDEHFGKQEYRVFKFALDDYDEKSSLPTIQDFLDGTIRFSHDEWEEHQILENLQMVLHMYFTMGFNVIEKQNIIQKIAGESVDLEQKYEAPIYLYKSESNSVSKYLFDNFFENDLFGITSLFYVENEKVIYVDKTPVFFKTKEEFNTAKKETGLFRESEHFIKQELTEADFFNKYPLNITPERYFKHPKANKFSFPKTALKVPQGIIDFNVNEFHTTHVDVNRLYFYVNEEGDNPLEWKAAFIVAKDLKKPSYLATKVFALKDFNTVYEKTQEEDDLKYSSDLKEFLKKKAKAFKKAKLKPYDTAKVFELLSTKSLEALNKQKPIAEFGFQGNYFKNLVTCYENYANIWITGNDKRHYLQFFPDEASRIAWLNTMSKEEELLLYPKEQTYIIDFVNHIKSEEDSYTLKNSLTQNANFAKNLKSEYTRRDFFKADFEVKEGDWEVEGDLIISREKSLLLKGNLKVSGSLFFTSATDSYSSTKPFLIIEGNITAKNLLLNGGFENLQVDGDFIIENFTACYYSKGQTALYVGGVAKTDILLHEAKNVVEYIPYFEFSKEVNPYSAAILEKSIFGKDSYDLPKIQHQIIFDFLKEGKKILTDNIEEAKVDLEEYHKLKFERRMKDWGNFYPEYAGCETVGVYEDNEIKGSAIHPSSGDWVVHDIRGKSGTYGVSHEDYSIYNLKVKKPANFGIDYTQKPLKLLVSAEELMNRYIQISMLYMNWAHRKTVGFGVADVAETYQKEKAVFKEDPHLALYWLNHFGATLDPRYYEVVKDIEDHNLVDKLVILKEPLAFFKKTDAFYNLEIGSSSSGKDEFKDLFLIRRSYLVYHEQTYKNYDSKNLDLWWKSVSIYPKVEENLIVRMRWLKNNLNKCDNWNDFDTLTKEENKNIPLLSLVLACNPNTSEKDKTKYADLLLTELFEHRNHFKTPHKKQFAEILLWDVRDFVNDKAKLKEVAKFYFQGNETCKEYQDIQAVLGEKNENLEDVRTALEKLNTAFEGYNRFDTPVEEKLKYHKSVVTLLDSLTPEILIETALNVQNHELAKRYFVYLWNAEIPNKKEALVRLFIYIEMSGHNVSEEIFGKDFTRLVKGDDDPNLEIAQALLTIPEADFRNDGMWQNSKQAAAKFFLSSAHQPKIFKFLIDTVKQAPTKENEHILDAIYTTLFSTEYDSKINPVLKFSKKQVETMLETICEWFLAYGYHAEGYRSIYGCDNPLAEEWVIKHMNDKKWLKQFAHISTFYDPLDEELKDAFESALEYIEQGKHDTYLEFKDDKSHKFWKISFFRETFIVTYGKIGTEGRESEKSFETEEECFKAGDKLVAQKLKKGYKVVEK